MDNNELIFKLVSMLNSKNASQIGCCADGWIKEWIEEWIKGNKATANANVAAPNNLIDRAKLLSPFTPFDKTKLKYFLFAPINDNRWKVFALDLKGNVLSQLEDYEGEIKANEDKKQEERFYIEV